jgi:hypothetical protein
LLLLLLLLLLPPAHPALCSLPSCPCFHKSENLSGRAAAASVLPLSLMLALSSLSILLLLLLLLLLLPPTYPALRLSSSWLSFHDSENLRE